MGNKLRGTRRVAMTVGAMAMAGVAIFGSASGALASTAGNRGILLPGNPTRSMAPATSLLTSCSAGDDSSMCNQLALTAIGRARQSLEKMGGMSFSLPAYGKLTIAQQLFVVVNLERTERGLAPAVVLSKSLNAGAQAGAQAGRDPAMGSVPRHMPGGARLAYAGANWSGGWINPLGADYAWMYDDGPGGSNLDCQAGSSTWCWGHRDIVLTTFSRASCHGGQGELVMGAGHAGRAAGYAESDTALLAGVCGPVPSDATFTWAKAKKLLGIR
jgi:hypothetical protein